MAKVLVFSVLDSKIQSFGPPLFYRSVAEATRAFGDVCDDPQTLFCKHPNDFSLMQLGTYDDSTGQFENLQAPSNLGLALSFKRPPTADMPLFKREG